MFSHIMIGARDLGKMVAFYDDVMKPLGMRRVADMDEAEKAGIIWQQGDRRWPQFVLRRPLNRLPATWGNGVQISFATASRATVDLVWAISIEKGAQDEGAPGIRLRYAKDFYAAYCRDPEGNKLCFVHANWLPGGYAETH